MRISDWSSDVCSSDLSPWAKTACGLGERERLEPRCRASGRRIITAPIAKIRFCDYTGTTFSEGNPNGCFRHLCPRQDRQYNEGTRHRRAGRDGPFDLRRYPAADRSEEHTSELQSLMRISYAVFCLKKKNNNK